jgi:Condensation domain
MPASKSARLCWGQQFLLLRYHQLPAESRHEAHITTDYPVPEGCTLEQVGQALSHVVRRHEGLRTVYDLDARPWPLQRVEPPARLPVSEATTEDDGTPPPAEVLGRLTRAPFEVGREWPIRACAVTTGGRVRSLHLVLNHVSFDDVGLEVLRRDLAAVLAACVERRPVALAPVPQQPIDLARFEAERPPGAVDAALEHWRGEVRRLPADVFAARRGPSAPGAAYSASLTVPSLLATSRGIVARGRCWPAAVYLAAYAVTVAAYTGERTVPHRLYTSQRAASGFAFVLTCLSYPTLASLDLTDDPAFSTVLRRAAARIEQAMTHAHVPYDRVAEFVAREGTRRGRPVRVATEVNFLNYAPRSCGTRRERFTWKPDPADWARAGSDVYFRIYEWSDGVTLALQARAEVMDRDAVERFLRGYARVLEAHRDPGPGLTVSQAVDLIGFPPVPARTLDPEPTAAALCAHDAVCSARLETSAAGLVARVETTRPVTPAELRTHLLGAMYDVAGAQCPDWFRISDPQGRRPVVEGDGSPAGCPPPATEAEKVLLAVTAEANGLGQVDPADSYVAAGGRVLRLPRVLSDLRELGWDGVSVNQLSSARPLRTLAERMTRSPQIGNAR